MASDDVDTQIMNLSTLNNYPSPAPEPEVKAESDQPPKKKRKAWGQPVPEIKQILPPRKRAKTVEEKEQRKNERILRNRKAADKSRKRQKAAVTELEHVKSRMEEENTTLRTLLEQYRSRFGEIEGLPLPPSTQTFAPSIKPEPSDSYSAATPMSYQSDFDSPSMADTPTMSHDSPMEPALKVSPSLAPTLFPSHDQQVPSFAQHELMDSSVFENQFSGLTQYPAAILCDLQCQPETLVSNCINSQSNQDLNQFIQILMTLSLLTIYETLLTSILSPMHQICHILTKASSTTFTPQALSSLLEHHFLILLSLITIPTTTGHPAIFRTKLLSRLLACSPIMARHLLAATNRELQRVVESGALAEDAQARELWARLLTTKWVIIRLEREHWRYRRVIGDKGEECEKLPGVDYEAVARNLGRWTALKTGGHQKTDMYEHNVHGTELEVH